LSNEKKSDASWMTDLGEDARYFYRVGGNEDLGKEDVLKAIVEQQNWQAAWLRAIALAWSNKDFETALRRDPNDFLKRYCDYDLPRSLEVRVEKDERSEWIPGDPQKFNWRWRLRKTTLILYLPNAPEEETEWPVALAAYESAGKVYPFTTAF
jgi:ribosomally synthesized peptide (two-chain TOMM family)